MSKQTLCILAGGRSPEHEVSLVSASNIIAATNREKYSILLIGIARDGKWYSMEVTTFSPTAEIGSQADHHELVLQPFSDKPILRKADSSVSYSPDVIFPITHGVYGEDGTLQGLLEHLNIPYIGPGVLGSAMGMDKDITKKLASMAGVNVVPSVTHFSTDTIDESAVISNLGLPLFVKPVNMGSGVGVIKADSADTLSEAIHTAFTYDSKILIEKAIQGREVETAVLGNEEPRGTRVGEIVIEGDYYTYENKYENDKAGVIIPAENLSEHSMNLIARLALKTYRAVHLEGMARIDFFYCSDDEIYLNEVNTLPGFTDISMYPKLWNDMGISFTSLIDELIRYALERHQKKSGLKRSKD